MNLNLLLTHLKEEEGFKPYLYDDSNGKLIQKGSTLVGNPTIGYGWCLSTNPLPDDLAETILQYFATSKYNELVRRLPWITDQPDNVQVALADMAFQLGVNGLFKFNTFLSMVKQGNYEGACDDLDSTLWAKQTPNRVKAIKQCLLNTK